MTKVWGFRWHLASETGTQTIECDDVEGPFSSHNQTFAVRHSIFNRNTRTQSLLFVNLYAPTLRRVKRSNLGRLQATEQLTRELEMSSVSEHAQPAYQRDASVMANIFLEGRRCGRTLTGSPLDCPYDPACQPIERGAWHRGLSFGRSER